MMDGRAMGEAFDGMIRGALWLFGCLTLAVLVLGALAVTFFVLWLRS